MMHFWVFSGIARVGNEEPDLFLDKGSDEQPQWASRAQEPGV